MMRPPREATLPIIDVVFEFFPRLRTVGRKTQGHMTLGNDLGEDHYIIGEQNKSNMSKLTCNEN